MLYTQQLYDQNIPWDMGQPGWISSILPEDIQNCFSHHNSEKISY